MGKRAAIGTAALALLALLWISPSGWTETTADGVGSKPITRKGSGMAGSVNKVILVGNLGRDPEVRKLNSGDSVVNLRIATSESWRDKASGERKERTEWHSVVIFNENLGKIAEQYLKKGSKVYIEGQLQTRKWTDKDGQERYTTEVVLQRFRGEMTLLDSRGGGAGGEISDAGSDFGRATPMEAPRGGRAPARAGGGASMAEDLDDEIPF